MKITVNKPAEVNVKTLRLNVRVRYPNDGAIITNLTPGNEDNLTEMLVWDDIQNPKMPHLYNVNGEWRWRLELDIETGKIKDWPEVKARINYKVCDEFECDILDSAGIIVRSYDGYVPEFFGIGECNYGDYIIMDIDETGQIIDWNCAAKDIEKMINN